MRKEKKSPIIKPRKSWDNILEEYKNRQIRRRNSELTITKYVHVIGEYFTACNYIVSKDTIRDYLKELQFKDFQLVSINKTLTILKTFFKWVKKNEFITIDPSEEILYHKKGHRLVTVIRGPQMKKLYQDIEQDKTLRIQDVLMFDVFYGSGIRTDELCNIRIEDVSTPKLTLKIIKGKGGKQRLVAIPKRTMDEVRTHITMIRRRFPTNEYLFPTLRGKQMRGSTVYLRISKILSRVVGKKKGAHTLRHSFATVMIENGAPMVAVKEQLGHASMDTTQQYVHNTITRLKNVHKQAHPKG